MRQRPVGHRAGRPGGSGGAFPSLGARVARQGVHSPRIRLDSPRTQPSRFVRTPRGFEVSDEPNASAPRREPYRRPQPTCLSQTPRDGSRKRAFLPAPRATGHPFGPVQPPRRRFPTIGRLGHRHSLRCAPKRRDAASIDAAGRGSVGILQLRRAEPAAHQSGLLNPACLARCAWRRCLTPTCPPSSLTRMSARSAAVPPSPWAARPSQCLAQRLATATPRLPACRRARTGAARSASSPEGTKSSTRRTASCTPWRRTLTSPSTPLPSSWWATRPTGSLVRPPHSPVVSRAWRSSSAQLRIARC